MHKLGGELIINMAITDVCLSADMGIFFLVYRENLNLSSIFQRGGASVLSQKHIVDSRT
jgi:hypothetical protein